MLNRRLRVESYYLMHILRRSKSNFWQRTNPLVCCLLASLALAQSPQGPPPGSRENPILLSLPDSLFTIGVADSAGEYQAFVVRGRRASSSQSEGRTLLGLSTIETSDAAAAADLAPLLPSSRSSVNSRGESVLSVRGASERHTGVFWDDIPLTVPWDERLDMSLIPVDALGGVREQRGLPTLELGPNLLAGRLDLLPWRLGLPGQQTRLGIGAGEAGAYELRGAHARRSEDLRWDFLVAAGRRSRDATVLPEGFRAPYHQPSHRLARTNSDLELNSAMLSARRGFARDAELRLLVLGYDGNKGVPPESHVEAARFWRYPQLQRLLIGLSGQAYLDEARGWRLDAAISFDRFAQEIRSFDDASYTTPALSPGVEYEDDDDRTWYGRLKLERSLGDAQRVRTVATGRMARHDESLAIDESMLRYEQRLGSLVGEWEWDVSEFWRLRLGGGYEVADTPKTGDKAAKPSNDAPVALAAVEWEPRQQTRLAWRLSRRSRFPSLRESFSGALGRFVLNADLGPEEQDLIELNFVHREGHVELAGGFFCSQLSGAIERIELPPLSPGDPERFQRTNLDDVRTLGAELSLAANGPRGMSSGFSLLALHARSEADGDYARYLEDRPEFQSSAWLGYTHAAGWRLRLENVSTGARASAGSDALLASQTQWNARLAYVWFGRPFAESELFLRVNNLLDQELWSQTGLPEPGQSFWGGLRVRI